MSCVNGHSKVSINNNFFGNNNSIFLTIFNNFFKIFFNNFLSFFFILNKIYNEKSKQEPYLLTFFIC